MIEALRECDVEGAYGVVLSPERKVLLVEANGGRVYLPGGRLEPGESAEHALLREIEEECGWPARLGVRLGAAVQPIFGGHTLVHAHYFTAAVAAGGPGCGEHPTLWLTPGEAAGRVHRAGDAWAIGQGMQRAEAAAAAPRRHQMSSSA